MGRGGEKVRGKRVKSILSFNRRGKGRTGLDGIGRRSFYKNEDKDGRGPSRGEKGRRPFSYIINGWEKYREIREKSFLRRKVWQRERGLPGARRRPHPRAAMGYLLKPESTPGCPLRRKRPWPEVGAREQDAGKEKRGSQFLK